MNKWSQVFDQELKNNAEREFIKNRGLIDSNEHRINLHIPCTTNLILN